PRVYSPSLHDALPICFGSSTSPSACIPGGTTACWRSGATPACASISPSSTSASPTAFAAAPSTGNRESSRSRPTTPRSSWNSPPPELLLRFETQLLDLARDGVATDAEARGGVDPPSARMAQGRADHGRLELTAEPVHEIALAALPRRVPLRGQHGAHLALQQLGPCPAGTAHVGAARTLPRWMHRGARGARLARRAARGRGGGQSDDGRGRRGGSGDGLPQLRREVLGIDGLARRHHGEPVADVLELAHVARPRERLHGLERRFREALRIAAQLAR